ncbi:MAG: hypothetical protein EWV80_09855, partial [Microcystis aeruginosa Ma_QC_B_20070730_S2]
MLIIGGALRRIVTFESQQQFLPSNPAFLTKKENGVSESPTQYRFEPDFSPAPPTTVCCENVT